jgi:hypothetical protein
MARIVAAASLLMIGATPLSARECRTPDAPPGVRAQLPPGCQPARSAVRPNSDQSRARAGKTPGFIDLGNGTEVRIEGRVRAETILRR